MELRVEAPIAEVTVYPSQARVTRRGRVTVPKGVTDVVVPALPLTMLDDSVRVSGRSTGARILGVDVARRFHAESPDERVQRLEQRLRELRGYDRGLADDEATQAALITFLDELAQRAGGRFAMAMASGTTGPDGVASFTQTLAGQLAAVHERQRQLAIRREEVGREVEAAVQELATLRQQQQTERREILVTVEAEEEARIDLAIAYLVTNAWWVPVYDARLTGNDVALMWHGLVTQRSGEDWPAAQLTLSTARPAVNTKVPELDPWYIGEFQPLMRTMRSMMLSAPAPQAVAAMAEGSADEDVAFEKAAAPMPDVTATAEQGATAVSYRLPRPVAVPADGAPHKAMITAITLGAVLDYLTVPKLAEEAYLRALVTNTSPHTLLPGKVSVFHDADFVGTTSIESVAPGEEVELQLGADDRLKVERKLVRRETSKNLLGGNRKTSVTYRITLESHLPSPASVTVCDQFPISSHESVRINHEEATPQPDETDDLGEVTWRFELAPDTKQVAELSFQLEHPRGMVLSGWTD